MVTFIGLYFYLVIPFVMGILFFIIGLIWCIIAKIRKKKSIPGMILAILGFGIVFWMIMSFIIAGAIGRKEKQDKYDAAPNKIMLDWYDDESFQIDEKKYERVDFLNHYVYDLFEDTDYTAVINMDNYHSLRVCKNGSYAIFYAYGKCMYCEEGNTEKIWNAYKNNYSASIVSFFDYEQCDVKIDVNDMDQYLEIWRCAESIADGDIVEVDKNMNVRTICATSEDDLSELKFSVGWDESGNWYFIKTKGYGVKMSEEYASFFEGLDLKSIMKP